MALLEHREMSCIFLKGVPFDARDGGPWPCRAGGRHPAQRLHAGDTVETKRAAHPFSAIRMRSLNDPHQGSLPTVQTVKPLSRCTTPASRCKPSHPSPSAHQFRLPFNWLAPSELRRICCSDEGDARDRQNRPTSGAHTAAPRFQSPVTRLKRKERCTGLTAIRMRSLNDARQGSLPTVQTVKPAGGRHPAQRLRAGDTVETKRAAHRFSASLNDPRRSRFQPCKPLHR